MPYSGNLILDYFSLTNEETVEDCLEKCRNHETCKSVSLYVSNSSMQCYLYGGRIYVGSRLWVAIVLFTIHLRYTECPIHLGYSEDLTSECPIHLGYSEDPTSKIYTECPIHLGYSEDSTSKIYTECPIHFRYSEDPTSKIYSKYNSIVVLFQLNVLSWIL
ncbi:hypothetical protein LOTGIDRAFT_152102 [Lottia gigantea]|uniref:Apple domain-containing protein n=1 Tax=Lottia gigantea TaxID=225164 RepID=V4B493_LOTGI|nr:hypothetical protein LOTGIDRAFT_152102 [Lottia gigantea]ESP05273.1 hypothetical protein LOTGIDRAFT_152102 [Lottia gigantea]